MAARWVLPIDAAPIGNGAMLIGADGRIIAVGRDDAVPSPPDGRSEHFDDALILPGLINTHTHLELTGLDASETTLAFPAWIRGLRARKAERTPDDFLNAARAGVRDNWAMGATTVADCGDSGAAAQALAELGGRGIAYHEVFGPHPSQLDESLVGLRARMNELAQFVSERVRLGVSPHAPYTVSGPLFRAVSDWARAEGMPLCLHLAESLEESELFEQGSGGFAEMWRGRSIPLPSSRGTPVEWVDRHGVLGETTLCVHVVRATTSDLQLLAKRRAAVAHCPLSNQAHRHGRAPLGEIRRLGIAVGVGTDSTASVGRLDLRGEARAARDLGGLTWAEALSLCTLDAARALGLDGEVGSLTVGKWGDVSVWEAEPIRGAGSGKRGAGEMDLEELARVVLSPDALCLGTYVAGKEVWRAER